MNGNSTLEFLSDSPEQVAGSMKRLGLLWDRLCEAFRAAMARVNESQQELDRPAINETIKRGRRGCEMARTLKSVGTWYDIKNVVGGR